MTLNVSFDQALHRAQSDPNRNVTRAREKKLRLQHGEFLEALLFLRANSLVLDADRLSPVELAESINESVLADVE